MVVVVDGEDGWDDEKLQSQIAGLLYTQLFFAGWNFGAKEKAGEREREHFVAWLGSPPLSPLWLSVALFGSGVWRSIVASVFSDALGCIHADPWPLGLLIADDSLHEECFARDKR